MFKALRANLSQALEHLPENEANPIRKAQALDKRDTCRLVDAASATKYGINNLADTLAA